MRKRLKSARKKKASDKCVRKKRITKTANADKDRISMRYRDTEQ